MLTTVAGDTHKTTSAGTALVDQLTDIHSAIINEPNVPITERSPLSI
ncbi:hypothetical protein LSH36_277g02043 [Paralvinella palmiformis]|uniref:Uncharacterized protein n=1 Tax=Paralvinella palmiformis TaxID=53620 RepID=A0AAD9JJ03_9ANNE|nr:hypothetical protein LSH36_277g02043 [Paralvinella palmiformis]